MAIGNFSEFKNTSSLAVITRTPYSDDMPTEIGGKRSRQLRWITNAFTTCQRGGIRDAFSVKRLSIPTSRKTSCKRSLDKPALLKSTRTESDALMLMLGWSRWSVAAFRLYLSRCERYRAGTSNGVSPLAASHSICWSISVPPTTHFDGGRLRRWRSMPSDIGETQDTEGIGPAARLWIRSIAKMPPPCRSEQ